MTFVNNIIVDPNNWVLNKPGTIVNINDPELNKPSFALFPNPTKDWVQVSFDNKTIRTEKVVSIYTPDGSLYKVYKTFNQTLSIDLSELAKGIYFINVLSENQSYGKSVIKY